jgi:hypothetical protein
MQLPNHLVCTLFVVAGFGGNPVRYKLTCHSSYYLQRFRSTTQMVAHKQRSQSYLSRKMLLPSQQYLLRMLCSVLLILHVKRVRLKHVS